MSIERLLAVQAQDARGARLAVRSRSTGLHATDVDAALNDRSMVIAGLNRGTPHLVGADDYWWLHPLTTRQLEAVRPTTVEALRRDAVAGLRFLGVDRGDVVVS